MSGSYGFSVTGYAGFSDLTKMAANAVPFNCRPEAYGMLMQVIGRDQRRTQRARNEARYPDLTTQQKDCARLDDDKESDAPSRPQRIRKIKRSAAGASVTPSSTSEAANGSLHAITRIMQQQKMLRAQSISDARHDLKLCSPKKETNTNVSSSSVHVKDNPAYSPYAPPKRSTRLSKHVKISADF